jgi:hypothetical protein
MKKLMADFLADRHVDPPANVELPAAHFLESP